MSNFRRNTRNKENILYKTLTRIFSGPIMRQRRQFYTRERRQDMSKYQSWFKSASGQPFKIQSRDIFSNMTAKLISEQQRAERYSDFDFMVYDPILAVCLDIYAEEITSCTIFEDVLKINCKNQEIKQILHELYYNILNVRSNLFYWVKTMCKYGDFFLYLDIDDELGVVNVVSLPLREVERMEGKDPTNPQYVQFQWNSGGMTFENWQVAHFRILGDEKFAPYGSSIFEPARRIWRMYELIQEAMLSYRITRSAERRVFYIDVGNIEADKVEEYVLQAKSELKKNMILDEDSGRVDLRYNPLPVSSETYVPLLDGRILKIKDVCKEFESGNDLWVHSINDDTFESIPGKVVWCGKNYTTDKLIRVWLDNQTYVETAPEHPFILKNGEVLRADELEIGQSLMTFNDENVYKVGNVEIIERCEDVYCMTIEGANGEQDRHNFAVLSTNPETKQPDKYGIYIKNSIEDDFFIPVRGDSQTRIEPLPGGQYTGDIDDVKYMQNRMLASIKIPSSYVLSGDEGSGDEKTNLAQKDVRFANTVMRIQRNVIEELEFVGKVHLVALGFKGDDISNFTLSLHNPSKIATLQELEEWRTKFDVASAATEGFFSKRHVATKFFGLSEEEFIRNQREIFNDKKFELQLEQLVQMGNIEAQEGSFGPVGGGGLTGSEEVGNLGNPNEEIPIEPTTPATEEPGDETLLAQPSEPAKRDDDEGSNYVKIKKNLFGPNSYTTPGSKGKMYTPQTHDRRTSSGPRNQQMKSLWSKESSKNTKRDRPNSAARELMGLGRGILEENLNPQNIETLEELEYLQIEQIENILVDEKK